MPNKKEVLEHVVATKVAMQNLQQKIAQWAHDRNIIAGSSKLDQATKLIEELGELAAGIAKGKQQLIEDSIGDMAVVLTIYEAIQYHPQGSPLEFTNHTNIDIRNAAADVCDNKYIQLGMLGTISSALLLVNTDNALVSSINENEDIFPVWAHLHLVAVACGTTVEHCTELAYNEIKDRKGKLINGVFIKEEDLG